MTNSTPPLSELKLLGQIDKVVSDARTALAELPKASRWFHVFWLLGPFVLLIERSPADAWLTICALSFAVRAILKKDGSWLNVFWVRSVFAFWGVCLLSAALSELPPYSLGEAFVWIRFPLFAMASCFWLGTDRRLLIAMLCSGFLGMMLMNVILLAELYFVGSTHGRLSWPYGDFVTGNYLAKACMPAFCIVAAIATSAHTRLALPAGFIFLLSIVMSLLTGERMNFLLRLGAAALASLSWRPALKMLIAMSSGAVAAILLSVFFYPRIIKRAFAFLWELPTDFSSPYLRVWYGGVEAFLSRPIIGIGPDNYRMLCTEISGNSILVDCHTQPHNFYVQIAAETGLVGLLFATVMIGSLIWTCFACRNLSNKDLLRSTAYIVPLAFFFPLQSTADFFGQWNNIFMWSALGIALSSAHSK